MGRGVDEVIGGWQITGTITWAGGLPWTPGLSGGVCNLEQDTGVCRPNKGPGSFPVGAGSFDGATHTVTFFKPLVDASGASLLANGGALSGFADPGLNHIGNRGYDSFRGPRYFGTDGAIAKNFQLMSGSHSSSVWTPITYSTTPSSASTKTRAAVVPVSIALATGWLRILKRTPRRVRPMECVSFSLDCA